MGNVAVNGPEVTVDLVGVANAQQLTLTLFGVSDGVNTCDTSLSMGCLLGNTDGFDRLVSSSDLAQTKGQVGRAVTSANFRNDVNANGTINAADVAQVKSKVGTSIPVELVGSTESCPTKGDR